VTLAATLGVTSPIFLALEAEVVEAVAAEAGLVFKSSLALAPLVVVLEEVECLASFFNECLRVECLASFLDAECLRWEGLWVECLCAESFFEESLWEACLASLDSLCFKAECLASLRSAFLASCLSAALWALALATCARAALCLGFVGSARAFFKEDLAFATVFRAAEWLGCSGSERACFNACFLVSLLKPVVDLLLRGVIGVLAETGVEVKPETGVTGVLGVTGVTGVEAETDLALTGVTADFKGVWRSARASRSSSEPKKLRESRVNSGNARAL